MANTAEVRMSNINAIRQILADGQEYTASSMSAAARLSVATCNGILKLLAAQGEAATAIRQTNEVGRRTVFFRLNPEYSPMLYLTCCRENDTALLLVTCKYLFGDILLQETMVVPDHSGATLMDTIKALRTTCPGIRAIMLSLPTQADVLRIQAQLHSCDIPLCARSSSAYYSRAYFSETSVGIVTFIACLSRELIHLFHSYTGYITGESELTFEELKQSLPGFLRIYCHARVVLYGDRSLCQELRSLFPDMNNDIRIVEEKPSFRLMETWAQTAYLNGVDVCEM